MRQVSQLTSFDRDQIWLPCELNGIQGGGAGRVGQSKLSAADAVAFGVWAVDQFGWTVDRSVEKASHTALSASCLSAQERTRPFRIVLLPCTSTLMLLAFTSALRTNASSTSSSGPWATLLVSR
jgi:hypothetical protein